jgi:hypothetical protein
MARRGDDGCAVFLLLVIVSCVIGHFNGAGVGWLVFFVVLFFSAIS